MYPLTITLNVLVARVIVSMLCYWPRKWSLSWYRIKWCMSFLKQVRFINCIDSYIFYIFEIKFFLHLMKTYHNQHCFHWCILGMRGGCSTIFKRLATANNTKLKNYDPRIEDSTIFYTDCNNLYGFVLSLLIYYKSKLK